MAIILKLLEMENQAYTPSWVTKTGCKVDCKLVFVGNVVGLGKVPMKGFGTIAERLAILKETVCVKCTMVEAEHPVFNTDGAPVSNKNGEQFLQKRPCYLVSQIIPL